MVAARGTAGLISGVERGERLDEERRARRGGGFAKRSHLERGGSSSREGCVL